MMEKLQLVTLTDQSWAATAIIIGKDYELYNLLNTNMLKAKDLSIDWITLKSWRKWCSRANPALQSKQFLSADLSSKESKCHLRMGKSSNNGITCALIATTLSRNIFEKVKIVTKAGNSPWEQEDNPICLSLTNGWFATIAVKMPE